MNLVDTLQDSIASRCAQEELLATFRLEVQSHVTKKNGRPVIIRNGKPAIGKSNALVCAERHLTLHLKDQANRQGLFRPLNVPIWAVFHFYFPHDKFYTLNGQISRNLPDLSNLYELPQDCLQKANIIANDSLIHSHDLSRRLPGDKYVLEIFLLAHKLDTNVMRHA